ncbi:MAG TPA: Omp28-related outer membrane protein [Saprospiraceae bacterium]|nr:Omp28-related outer membrane protein [Saprospiraceae bacterium]HMQ84129.1 Omp28-related outer membrane protein [Saprospiraceae bacterium]
MKILTGVILILALNSPVLAQKRVLLEKYTSAFCGSCPNGTLIAHELQQRYPELVLIFHHSSVDGMANEHSTEWKQGFNILGTPLGIINRQPGENGSIAAAPLDWEERIVHALEEPHYLDIHFNGTYNPYNRQLSLDVSTTFHELPPAGELRLNVVVVEDSVLHAGFGFDQSNYYNEVEGHPLFGLGSPIYFYPHHHVVRDIIDETWGTPNAFPIHISLQTPYIYAYDYVVSYPWDDEKVKLVAFVSIYDAENPNNHQVLNVQEINLFDLIPNATSSPAQQSPFHLSPNPVTGQLFIQSPPDTYQLSVFNAYGQLIEAKVQQNADVFLDVSQWVKGIYYFHFSTEKAQFIHPIVIQ